MQAILIAGLFVGFFFLGMQVNAIKMAAGKVIYGRSQLSPISNYSECANLSLEATAYCLRDFLEPYYNYSVRPDTPRPLEDILTTSGDCYDYTLAYKYMGEDLGYGVYTESSLPRHTYAQLQDKNHTGYCIMDQMIVWCTRFAEEDQNEI